ncbi:MAG: hypothetical protein IJR59_02095, partial [Firmicutes bacterium]|nr:hypothetical protein [Bacillota bacterium]
MKTKKIRAEDIIFFLFCIFNTYILPPVVDGNFDVIYKNETQLFKNVEIMQAFGGSIGCFALMFGAAAYSFYAAKKRADFGRDRPILISLSVFVPLGLVTVYLILKGWLDGFEFAGGYMPFIFAAAGIWLGRLLAGRYKGVRQFYIADIIYIILCLALAVLFMIFEKRNVVTDEISVFFAVTLAVISFMYGRFSEFEYMQERLLRAVTVSAAIFAAACAPFLVTGFAGNFTSCCAYMSKYIFNTGSLAAIGVILGYYLRIMRVGGESEYKKSTDRAVLITGVIITAAFVGYAAYYARYFAYESKSLYDIAGAENADITAMCFYDGKNELVTASGGSINKMLDIIKNEKGAIVSTLPYKHSGDWYELVAYNADNMVFTLNMRNRGEMELTTFTKDVPTAYRVVLPRQYYGLNNSDKEDYISIIKSAAPPTYDEKMGIINASNENLIYAIPGMWKSFLDDPDPQIRRAAAEKANAVWLAAGFAADSDPEIKSAAYDRLKQFYFEKSCFDDDFYSINYYGCYEALA